MKKFILALIIIVLLICLVPFPAKVKDGGSIHYDAILYDIYDVHSLYNLGPDDTEVRYVEGFIIEIFGIQVYNNTNPHIDNFSDSPDLENWTSTFL